MQRPLVLTWCTSMAAVGTDTMGVTVCKGTCTVACSVGRMLLGGGLPRNCFSRAATLAWRLRKSVAVAVEVEFSP